VDAVKLHNISTGVDDRVDISVHVVVMILYTANGLMFWSITTTHMLLFVTILYCALKYNCCYIVCVWSFNILRTFWVRDNTKPGLWLWTLDWTMDWTLDPGLDHGLDSGLN